MCATMPKGVFCAALAARLAFAWLAKTADSGFWVLYDFCMTFKGLMERNARDGKSTKTQRFKTRDTVEVLIYLAKSHFSLAKKEWW